jgi:hypothetical protein
LPLALSDGKLKDASPIENASGVFGPGKRTAVMLRGPSMRYRLLVGPPPRMLATGLVECTWVLVVAGLVVTGVVVGVRVELPVGGAGCAPGVAAVGAATAVVAFAVVAGAAPPAVAVPVAGIAMLTPCVKMFVGMVNVSPPAPSVAVGTGGWVVGVVAGAVWAACCGLIAVMGGLRGCWCAQEACASVGAQVQCASEFPFCKGLLAGPSM